MADKTDVQMTVEEFLELPESNQIVQLIHGEVLMSPSATLLHQRLVLAIAKYFSKIIPDGEVFIAPLDVYIGEGIVVQPDVFWVSEKNTQCAVIDDRYWRGAPDLVVEVLSPSNAQLDWGDKFEIYQQYSVREYWLVDQQALFVHVFRLENGKFARQGVFGKGQRFVSAVLNGHEVDVTALLEQ